MADPGRALTSEFLRVAAGCRRELRRLDVQGREEIFKCFGVSELICKSILNRITFENSCPRRTLNFSMELQASAACTEALCICRLRERKEKS